MASLPALLHLAVHFSALRPMAIILHRTAAGRKSRRWWRWMCAWNADM
jgi:hypothetical protein